MTQLITADAVAGLLLVVLGVLTIGAVGWLAAPAESQTFEEWDGQNDDATTLFVPPAVASRIWVRTMRAAGFGPRLVRELQRLKGQAPRAWRQTDADDEHLSSLVAVWRMDQVRLKPTQGGGRGRAAG